jgi:putative transposase
MDGRGTKTALARRLGIARSTLYYHRKRPEKDWVLKTRIEAVLHEHPSYGHRRIALALSVNKKRVRRVMKLFGMKPYRRRVKRLRKRRDEGMEATPYGNLLQAVVPDRPDLAWVSDFTHLRVRDRTVYVATVLDAFSREVVGASILTGHSTPLVLGAFEDALGTGRKPVLLHSDQGSEYRSRAYTRIVQASGVSVSMSRKSSPWENGLQEAFFSQFKIDLGDPSRFQTLGELVAEVFRTIHRYNHHRIHTALKMPPARFAERFRASWSLTETSDERGT